ncbi:protein-glutamate O-methyltransferase CheR [Paenibacillus sp. CC-CFT747]|nr:protein-glutamate O-methyltransferase CheR [Paenibacillus sp. CC-CFT747]
MNYCQSAGPNQLVTRAQTSEETIQKIFRLLHQKFHIDFTQYKQNSILRRIERRMAIHHIGDLHDYYQMLLGDVSEASVLWKEMLINVTRFFRDKEAFEVLKEEVMPRIFHKENQEIRIWVAGCSTGEETYSIAILLREYMESIGRKPAIKIFATDLDKDALDLASLGMYPAGIAADVSPDRLEKYFVKVGDRYQVSKELRKMIVFAHHNLVKDPPFLSIDLVTCRNVLIYFQPILQKKVLSLFHFSLATGGFLFLGASETIGELGKLYAPLHNKWNIFSKRNVIQRRPLNMVEISEPVTLPGQTLQGSQIMEDSKLFRKLDDLSQSLIEEFVPPCIIIDDNHDVVHTTGDVNAFLNVPRGKFSHNLFKMVPQSLSVALSTAVHKARKEKSEVIYKNIVMEQNGASRRILLKVKLFRTEKTNDKYILIAFLPDRELEKLAPASSPSRSRLEGEAVHSGSGAGAGYDAGNAADGDRAAGDVQRRAPGHERRTDCVERGAAEHERGIELG